MAPMDRIGVMAEVVIGELLQPYQFGVDGGGVGEVGVEGGWLGIHRGLRDVIDDRVMNALFDQEAKSILVLILVPESRTMRFATGVSLRHQLSHAGRIMFSTGKPAGPSLTKENMMNNPLHHLIERQHQRMRELRDDARDIASTVADEVWDKFEVEIEDATGGSYMFDMASSTQMALSSMLALSYDEAFERHVLGLLERLEKELHAAGQGESCFDGARIDLAGLRKSLKLRRHANEMIGNAIERAKPGPTRVLGTIFGDLVRDELAQMEALERDMQRDARRLRRELLGLREKIVDTICEETATVIQAARLAYIEMLDTLSRKHGTQQTIEAA